MLHNENVERHFGLAKNTHGAGGARKDIRNGENSI